MLDPRVCSVGGGMHLAPDSSNIRQIQECVMVSMQRILCPIDFSEFSRRALDRAVAIGRCHGSSVRALHVAWDPLLESVMPYVGPEGLEPLNWFVTTGRAYQEVLRVAAERNTISSSSGFMNAIRSIGMFGSTAEPIVRRATRPVLTIRPAADAVRAAA